MIVRVERKGGMIDRERKGGMGGRLGGRTNRVAVPGGKRLRPLSRVAMCGEETAIVGELALLGESCSKPSKAK